MPSIPLHRWYQKLLFGLLLAYLLYAALSALLVATWVKHKLVDELTQLTGKRVAIEQLWFNPFANSLTLAGFRLADEKGDVLRLERLYGNLDLLPLLDGKLYLRQLALEGPYVRVARWQDGSINLTQLIESPPPKEPATAQEEEGGLPVLPVIAQFSLSGGGLTLIDRQLEPDARLSIDAVSLEGKQLSMLPGDKGRFQLALDLPKGGRLSVDGRLGLEPLSLQLQVGLQRLELPLLNPWLSDYVTASLTSGHLNSRLDVTLQGKGIRLDADARASDLALSNEEGKSLLTFTQLGVEGVALSTEKQQLQVALLSLDGLEAQLARYADGSTSIDRLLVPSKAAEPDQTEKKDKTATGQTGQSQPWQFSIDKIALNSKRIQLLDSSLTPAYRLRLDDMTLLLNALNNSGKPASIQLQAQLAADAPSAEEPHLKAGTAVNAQLELRLKDAAVKLTGQAGLTQLHVESGKGDSLLTLESLAADGLSLDSSARQVRLDELAVTGLTAAFALCPQGENNISRLLPKPAAPKVGKAAASRGKGQAGAGWAWQVDQLTLAANTVKFADHSVSPAYKLKLSPLKVSLAPLAAGKTSQLELDAKLDGYAPLSVDGSLDVLSSQLGVDLAINLQGYDMTQLSPYTGRYIGHLVEKGHLQVNSDISLNGTKLDTSSQITAHQFFLGDEVDSKVAINAPVEFGLSILRDREDNISLPLNVAGDLASPSVSVSGLILDTLLNLMTKAATSPLSLLSLLSGGADLQQVAFHAGSAELDPAQLAGLAELARVLKKRPQLALGLAGSSSQTDKSLLKKQGITEKELAQQLQQLASQRASALKKALVEQYQVAASRLYLKASQPENKLAGVILTAVNQ